MKRCHLHDVQWSASSDTFFTFKSGCRFTRSFHYLLCWIKDVALARFLFKPNSRRILMRLISELHRVAIGKASLQLHTWGMSQPFHTHSSSKVTVWCDFQWALPLQLAPASSPRPFLHSKPWKTLWLKLGSRGQRWRVNVCWHCGSLPWRQSGVWI